MGSQQEAGVERQEAGGLLFGGSTSSHQTFFPLKGEACTMRGKAILLG